MAILATYLEVHLRLGESNATVVTHLFKFAAYGTAVLGGYLSDVVMGKFKVIAIFSGVYVVGGLMMAVGAIDSLWVNEPDGVPLPYMTYAALAVVALGTGAIKASVSSFVGDQFLQICVSEETPAFLLYSTRLQAIVLSFHYEMRGKGGRNPTPRYRFGRRNALKSFHKRQLYFKQK